MSEALVQLGPKTKIVDMFFGKPMVRTDWQTILDNPQVIDPKFVEEKLHSFEPVPLANPFEHTIWYNQQLLRIAYRYKKNLPLVSTKTCATCGKRFSDPVLEDNKCLWCAEIDLQTPWMGGRGGCFFIKVIYDPLTTAWGHLLYRYAEQDDPYMLWITLGYKTYDEGLAALYPIELYVTWLKVQTHGLTNVDMDDIITLDAVMAQSPPMKPEQFEKFLRSTIEERIQEETDTFGHTIRSTIREYARNENR